MNNNNLKDSHKINVYCVNISVYHRIDQRGVIKVSDFGLTEDVYDRNYFRCHKGEDGNEEKVPIRWMAPESIENDVCNEKTDVVSRTILFSFFWVVIITLV